MHDRDESRIGIDDYLVSLGPVSHEEAREALSRLISSEVPPFEGGEMSLGFVDGEDMDCHSDCGCPCHQ